MNFDKILFDSYIVLIKLEIVNTVVVDIIVLFAVRRNKKKTAYLSFYFGRSIFLFKKRNQVSLIIFVHSNDVTVPGTYNCNRSITSIALPV